MKIESYILLFRLLGLTVSIPGILLCMVSIGIWVNAPPEDLRRMVIELEPPTPPPEPEPIDLSSLDRVIRPYIPWEDEKKLLQLFDRLYAIPSTGWSESAIAINQTHD